MRSIQQILCGAVLTALVAVPLWAQHAAVSPAAVPPASVPATPVAPASTAPAGAPVLTREDVGGGLDGFRPYALANGDSASAGVVVVKDCLLYKSRCV